MQALFFFHPMNPFSSHGNSVIVPYSIDIDLERGVPNHERPNGISTGSSLCLPSVSHPSPSRRAVQKFIEEDARRQESLRCSPVFSPIVSTENKFKFGGVFGSRLLLENRLVVDEPTGDAQKYSNHERNSSDPLPVENYDVEAGPISAQNLNLDSFQDIPSASPCSLVSKFGCSANELKLFTLPSLLNTSVRLSEDSKFSDEAPPADVPENKSDITTNSLITKEGLSTVDKTYFPRKNLYDLHSISPTRRPRPSPKYSHLPSENIDPLRIIKHGKTSISAESASAILESELKEDGLQDMISMVQAVLVDLQHDEQERQAACELMHREPIWTRDLPHIMNPGKEMMDILDHEEDENESEDEYDDDLIIRTSCSPPPPYALADSVPCNPATTLSPIIIELFKAKGSVCIDTRHACSTPAASSTELSYLCNSPTPTSSVDSRLGDILASFENLIAIMTPKFKPFIASSHPPAIPTTGDLETKESQSLDLGSYAYDGMLRECASPWSDVL